MNKGLHVMTDFPALLCTISLCLSWRSVIQQESFVVIIIIAVCKAIDLENEAQYIVCFNILQFIQKSPQIQP